MHGSSPKEASHLSRIRRSNTLEDIVITRQVRRRPSSHLQRNNPSSSNLAQRVSKFRLERPRSRYQFSAMLPRVRPRLVGRSSLVLRRPRMMGARGRAKVCSSFPPHGMMLVMLEDHYLVACAFVVHAVLVYAFSYTALS